MYVGLCWLLLLLVVFVVFILGVGCVGFGLEWIGWVCLVCDLGWVRWFGFYDCCLGLGLMVLVDVGLVFGSGLVLFCCFGWFACWAWWFRCVFGPVDRYYFMLGGVVCVFRLLVLWVFVFGGLSGLGVLCCGCVELWVVGMGWWFGVWGESWVFGGWVGLV